MSYIRLVFLLSILSLLIMVTALSKEGRRLIYFRWDGGAVSTETLSLPNQLDSPDVLRWRTALDSGHSTPIACNGQIFLTTLNPATKELATLALAVDTGHILWKQIAPVRRIEKYAYSVGSAAQATPACDGQRLYVFSGSYGLICYDLKGKLLWEQRMGPFQDEYGAASSPVLVDDKVIIQLDHDANSFLTALDSKSGKVIWKSERPDAVRSYSTPAVWTRNRRKKLLVAGALELAGYDPSNGKRLWWIDGLARVVIPVPVPSGDVVYMSSWTPSGGTRQRIRIEPWSVAVREGDRNHDGRLSTYEVRNREILDRFIRIDADQNGTLDQEEWERAATVFHREQNGTMAVKPSSASGKLGEGALVWRCTRGAPFVATPLLDRGILWMVKDGGIVTSISAATGKVLKEKRLPSVGNYYASPITADGKLFFASQEGVVSIISNEQEWPVISSHNFMEKIYATPLVAEGCLFIRTENALYCYQARKP